MRWNAEMVTGHDGATGLNYPGLQIKIYGNFVNVIAETNLWIRINWILSDRIWSHVDDKSIYFFSFESAHCVILLT